MNERFKAIAGFAPKPAKNNPSPMKIVEGAVAISKAPNTLIPHEI